MYDRFRAWEREGFCQRLWAAGLSEFAGVVGIEWGWQSLDGVMTKATFAQAATAEAEGFGHHPTDRGEYGTKRSTLSEGHGLPIAVQIARANVHDMRLTADTLDAVVVERPTPTPEQPCTSVWLQAMTTKLPAWRSRSMAIRRVSAHIRPRGEDRANARSSDRAKQQRRWVVERLHSWLNRSWRLLVRWEKLAHTYRAFLHLACALLCFQRCVRYRTASVVSE